MIRWAIELTLSIERYKRFQWQIQFDIDHDRPRHIATFAILNASTIFMLICMRRTLLYALTICVVANAEVATRCAFIWIIWFARETRFIAAITFFRARSITTMHGTNCWQKNGEIHYVRIWISWSSFSFSPCLATTYRFDNFGDSNTIAASNLLTISDIRHFLIDPWPSRHYRCQFSSRTGRSDTHSSVYFVKRNSPCSLHWLQSVTNRLYQRNTTMDSSQHARHLSRFVLMTSDQFPMWFPKTNYQN